MRLSVRVRVQNALFRRVRFSSPAQTWSHLTQRRTLRRRPHVKAQSAPGDSRKSALWGCRSHGKAHSATGGSRKGAFCADGLTQRRTLDRHLTEKRTLQPSPHAKAHSAPAMPPRRDQKAHSGWATSRKSTFCVWGSPKGAFCMRAVAQSAPFREGPCAECAFP